MISAQRAQDASTKQGAMVADAPAIALRPPTIDDGRDVNALIATCAPLDTNSLYCNLLQCAHFADTSIVGEQRHRIVGFISGYRPPNRDHVLFIWQVAVAAEARGLGLGKRMLLALLNRESCARVTTLETTITESNRASWALFESVARTLSAPLTHRVMFDRHDHLDGRHETELLVTIGPLTMP